MANGLDKFVGGLLKSPTFNMGVGLLGAPSGARFGEGLLSSTNQAFRKQRELAEEELRRRRLEQVGIPAAQARQSAAQTASDRLELELQKWFDEQKDKQQVREIFSQADATDPASMTGAALAAAQQTGQGMSLIPQFMNAQSAAANAQRKRVNDFVFSPENVARAEAIANQLGIPTLNVLANMNNMFYRPERFGGIPIESELTKNIATASQALFGGTGGTPQPATQHRASQSIANELTNSYLQAVRTRGMDHPDAKDIFRELAGSVSRQQLQEIYDRALKIDETKTR